MRSRILILAALLVLLALLCACGGGAAALPFASQGSDSPPDETTQPVACQPTGCAK